MNRLGRSLRTLPIAQLLGAFYAIAQKLALTLLRSVLALFTRSFYRLDVTGREHVPATGGALLVSNHVSFVDGLLLLASLDRPIRFLVEDGYVRHPLLRPFMKSLGAIPLSASGGPRSVLRALREAGKSLDVGAIACIFPEGQITRTGRMLPFRHGFEQIVKSRNVPIIPVHLDRVWGSIFSYAGGRFFTKIPARIPYPVTVSFGRPLPPGTPVHEVRRAVQELGEEAWARRKSGCRPIHHLVLRAMRRHPFRLMCADATHPRVSCGLALAGAIALARIISRRWAEQEAFGILLPPGVAGMLVNLAVTFSGRASVNLNYTAGRAALASAVKQARLSSVVTSRTFLDWVKLDLPAGLEPLWLEDLMAAMSRGARLWALLLSVFAPLRLIQRACGMRKSPAPDDVVTVIFTSGSTGEPKGVELTQFNILANVEAISQVFHIQPSDRLVGVLPFFHSFGYTATLWLAATRAMGVIFHPTPLEAGPIGELVQRYRVTFLIATPTFLQLYERRCTPQQFGSLRVVLSGAEKLPDRLAQAFEDRFGIRPFEGYGVTECSPVITVSSPGFRAAGLYQPGVRRGHVGQPLPGVSARIVDPESFESLPPGRPGVLLVKGPNVMRGYLAREDLTASVMRDGWYITGDMASMDEDGFIQIIDHLSRFSKIGGEMVPHGQIEEALQEVAGMDTQVFAVTGLPDEQKGERLAVLHTLDEAAIPALVKKLAARGFPNLFLPHPDQFVKIDALPILGPGKLDLRAMRRIAVERLGGAMAGARAARTDRYAGHVVQSLGGPTRLVSGSPRGRHS